MSYFRSTVITCIHVHKWDQAFAAQRCILAVYFALFQELAEEYKESEGRQ